VHNSRQKGFECSCLLVARCGRSPNERHYVQRISHARGNMPPRAE